MKLQPAASQLEREGNGPVLLKLLHYVHRKAAFPLCAQWLDVTPHLQYVCWAKLNGPSPGGGS